jgi:hypothetical protein
MNEQPRIFECKTCGEMIGDGQPKNAVYMCDRKDGEWCGKCFDRKPCGMGKHGEGCQTMMICEPADNSLTDPSTIGFAKEE